MPLAIQALSLASLQECHWNKGKIFHNKSYIVKNSNWQEADQLAIYKEWLRVSTRDYRETNPVRGRVEAFNPGPQDYNTSAPNHSATLPNDDNSSNNNFIYILRYSTFVALYKETGRFIKLSIKQTDCIFRRRAQLYWKRFKKRRSVKLNNNQINARALISQSAMVYCAINPWKKRAAYKLLYKSNSLWHSRNN